MSKSQRTISPVPWRQFVAAYESATRQLSASSEVPDPLRELLDIATREFPDNPTMGKDFAVRFRAMLDLVSRELVEDWVTRDESGHPIKLHPALLLAAAEVRMTKTSRFPMKRFRARVFEIIAEEVA